MAVKRKNRDGDAAPDLAAEVRELRKALGYIQEQLANALGVSKATVQNWESGRRKPHRGAVKRMRELATDAVLLRRAPVSPISSPLRNDLHAALDIILDRAPVEIIKDVGDRLTRLAGDYGLRLWTSRDH